MSTIVITGGHHNSALVVAELLVKRGQKVVWIGHRRSSREDTNDSAEYQEVSKSNIPFHDLVTARLVPDVREWLRFPFGLLRAHSLLRRIRPDAILSFGGYLGGTVGLAGKLLHIPLYLHEQTITAGRANRLTGMLAKRIYLTWPASTKYFAPDKSLLVGLPLRESLLSAKPKQLFSRRKPTLLVMGGKQGAHILNQFIFNHVSELLHHYNIIHQTGANSHTHDDVRSQKLQDSLGSLADSYLPLTYIGASEIGSYLQSADIYFGRSGAHITYELAVLGLPSVLVPFRYTSDHEQSRNARYLEQVGLGHVINESDLSLSKMQASIKQVTAKPGKAQKLPTNAASLLVTNLLKDLRGV